MSNVITANTCSRCAGELRRDQGLEIAGTRIWHRKFDDCRVVWEARLAAKDAEIARLREQLERERQGYRTIIDFRKMANSDRYGCLTREELDERIAEIDAALASTEAAPSFKMNSDPEWLRKKAKAEDGQIVSVGGLVSDLEAKAAPEPARDLRAEARREAYSKYADSLTERTQHAGASAYAVARNTERAEIIVELRRLAKEPR